MSSSSTTRRRRHGERQRTSHHVTEDRSNSIPRSYDPQNDRYAPPEDQFRNLDLEQGEDEVEVDYDEDEQHTNFTEYEEPISGKGKERQHGGYEEPDEEFGKWSDHIWSDQKNCYYIQRTSSLGNIQYHYYDPPAEEPETQLASVATEDTFRVRQLTAFDSFQ